MNLTLIDQSNSETVNQKFNEILSKLNFKTNLIPFNKNEFKNEINLDYNKDEKVIKEFLWVNF